jgi:hypothetical protein
VLVVAASYIVQGSMAELVCAPMPGIEKNPELTPTFRLGIFYRRYHPPTINTIELVIGGIRGGILY